MATETLQSEVTPRGLDHRTVWRWHFYAGLFCIPFVLWLSVTGTIFLFHPQIQHWLDRPYDHLTITERSTANAQVQAALAAMPGTTLDSYQLPKTPTSAAEVLVDKGSEQFRVYVHPQTVAILKIDNEDRRVDVFTSRLHGELLIGKYGSWIIELAGSWAVVMIVTGLFLWWPSNANGIAGILYPRIGQGWTRFLERHPLGDRDLCFVLCPLSSVDRFALGKELGRIPQGDPARQRWTRNKSGLDDKQR